eukprot:6206069-Pleurochrysis_carterae.AAC.4
MYPVKCVCSDTGQPGTESGTQGHRHAQRRPSLVREVLHSRALTSALQPSAPTQQSALRTCVRMQNSAESGPTSPV